MQLVHVDFVGALGKAADGGLAAAVPDVDDVHAAASGEVDRAIADINMAAAAAGDNGGHTRFGAHGQAAAATRDGVGAAVGDHQGVAAGSGEGVMAAAQVYGQAQAILENNRLVRAAALNALKAGKAGQGAEIEDAAAAQADGVESITADQTVTTIQRGCRGGNPIIAAGAHTVGAGCQRHGCQDRRCAFAACIALAAVSVSHDDPPEKSGSSRCLHDCCVMR